MNTLVEIWKMKYAKKRVKKLLEDGRYRKQSLFYDDLVGLSWEDTKKKYLEQVSK